MANESNVSGFSAEEEEWLAEQRARKARRSKKGRGEAKEASLSINSLMDILVVLLVFLLMSFGDQPIKVTGQDLTVPKSITQLPAEDMMTITISRNAILVNDRKAVDVKSGAVDKSQKKGGEASLYIQPLFDNLTEAVKKKKRQTKLLGQTYEPVATVIADQTVPYRLITEVMYTAGQAELSKFKFAVIQTSARSNLAPGE